MILSSIVNWINRFQNISLYSLFLQNKNGFVLLNKLTNASDKLFGTTKIRFLV